MSANLNVVREIVNVSETVDDGAVVLLNEEFFEENRLDADEQLSVVNSLFILAYDSLNEDLRSVDDIELVEVSPDPIMYDLVSMVRMLLSDTSDFQLLVYFGGRVDRSTKLKQGLLHVLELLAVVEARVF